MRCLSILVIATASTVALTQIASAADLPRKAPAAPPPLPPVYSWTGFYVGANGGYGWSDRTVSYTPNDILAQGATCGGVFGSTCIPTTSFNINGGFGGLQAGYNWQFNTSWLVGIEADFDWSDIDGSGISNFNLAGVPSSNAQASQTIKWFGTVRGRLGYVWANNLLVFVTGGFAYGHIQEQVAINSSPFNSLGSGVGGFSFVCSSTGANCYLGNSSRTGTGWTAGGGVEYALWRNLTVKAEYLYVNFGGGDAINVVAPVATVLNPIPSSFTAGFSRTDFHTVRGGLNWKF